MRKFLWLIRRELWEHKLELIYAPFVVAMLCFILQAIAVLVFAASRELRAYVNSLGMQVLDWTQPSIPGEFSSMALLDNYVGAVFSIIWFVAFIQFVYCTNALFDERQNRSLVFWKSLPISDSAVVLSKAVAALVVCPAIATLAIAVLAGGFSLLGLFLALTLHTEGWSILQHASGFYEVAWLAICFLPGYALIAVTSVGWFLFISAAARSKPILWAVVPPVAVFAIAVVLERLGIYFLSTSILINFALRLLMSSVVAASFLNLGRDVENIWSSQEHYLNALTDFWFYVSLSAGFVFIIGAILLRKYRNAFA